MLYSPQLSVVFSIYKSVTMSNGMYILLGFGLVGFLALEVFMVSFTAEI